MTENSKYLLAGLIATVVVIGGAFVVRTNALANLAIRRKSAGFSNLKQLNTGMMLYRAEWDDTFPWPQDEVTLQNLLYLYSLDDEVWKTQNPDGSKFLFNSSLNGVSIDQVLAPADTLMLYESKPWPNGKRLVCFVDGRTRMANASQWAKYQASLHLKLKRRATKPLPLNWAGEAFRPAETNVNRR